MKLKLSSCLIVTGALLLSTSAIAAEATPTLSSLKKELSLPRATGASNSFEPLIQSWQKRYGTHAVEPLLELAAGNLNLDDPERYMAFMGAAKLGGKENAPKLVRFLKDRSWMIRSAALRALTALKNPSTAPATLPLLRDPALVVRLAAVDAVEKLQPPGAAEARPPLWNRRKIIMAARPNGSRKKLS